ncbi:MULTISPECIES: hypothetical protein [Cellulomonas]|uniref:hypothetical protein n=1 Tax=Cellulomonas TaxID=1707 RepID=UPI0010A78392|nr:MULTISPECIES: hypothetical protein [Cellulomonas]
MRSAKGTWIGGTVLVSLLLLVATWFLLVAPQTTATAEVRDEIMATEQSNELLELQLVQLRADFEKLPEHRAELATLQTQIPPTARISDYLREVEQLATTHGVTITSVGPGVPQVLEPAVAAAPAAPADAGTAPTEGAGDAGVTDAGAADASGTEATDPAVAPVPTGPAVPAGMVAVPISLTVVGGYEPTLAFLGALQDGSPRLLLVSSLTATGQKQAEAGGGRPATVAGDQELVLTGFVYVLPDALAVPPAPEAEPTPLPAPVPGKNPLVPIAGE